MMLIFYSGSKNVHWEKLVFSTNGAGKTGYSHEKERNQFLNIKHTPKSKQRDKYLNISPKTVKLIFKKAQKKHHDIHLGNSFTYVTPKAQAKTDARLYQTTAASAQERK